MVGNRLLFTFTPTGKLGQFEAQAGTLIATVGSEIVCVSPPRPEGAPKNQQPAWLGLGRCAAARGAIAHADEAFRRAEEIRCDDLEVFWQWACALPPRPENAKHRFRLYDMFLVRAPAEDGRRLEAMAAMRDLSGLRYVLDGTPQWDGCDYPRSGTWVLRTAGRRSSPAGGSLLAGFDVVSGALLWSRPYRPQNSPAGTSRFVSAYRDLLQVGERLLCCFSEYHFPQGSPWADAPERFCVLDARSGKVLAFGKAGTLLTGDAADPPAGASIPRLCPRPPLLSQGLLQIAGNCVELVDASSAQRKWSTRVLENAGEEVRGHYSLADKGILYLLVLTREDRSNPKGQFAEYRVHALRLEDGKTVWKQDRWPEGTVMDWAGTSLSLDESRQRLRLQINLASHAAIELDCATGSVLPQAATPARAGTPAKSIVNDAPLRSLRLGVGGPEIRLGDDSGSLLLETGGRQAGRFRFLRPPLTPWLGAIYERPDEEAVVVLDGETQSTYVFDRRRLVEFLQLPGE